jgi:hypothetical protein
MLGCLAFACLSVNACSAQVGETSETSGGNQAPVADPIASSQSPLLAAAQWSDQVDASGTIHVRHTVCDWVGPSSNPTAACGVAGSDWDDYALVGGGAEIEDVNHTAGALLTKSWMMADQRNWEASSKDHLVAFSHRLRAWTIAIKLDGISGADLRAKVHRIEVTTPSNVAAPTAFAPIPGSSNVLLGGGAKAIYTGAGQLLVASYPQFSGGSWGWRTNSKDHGISNPGKVLAQAIYMTNIPWGVGGATLDGRIFSLHKVPAVPGGYAVLTTAGPIPDPADLRMNDQLDPFCGCNFGWVLTGIGADTYLVGGANGRLLVDLFPLGWDRGSVHVTTKDHSAKNGGGINGYILGMTRF